MIILKLLGVGYLVGLICNLYLLIRAWISKTPNESCQTSYSEGSDIDKTWLGLSFWSSYTSMISSLLGGVIYYLFPQHVTFMKTPLFFAAIFVATFSGKNSLHKMDKIVIGVIIFLGIRIMIPHLQ